MTFKNVQDLVDLYPQKLQIELVYADLHHPALAFKKGTDVPYPPHAKLYTHIKIFQILQNVIPKIPQGMVLRVYDSLRPVVSQKIMNDYGEHLKIAPHLLSKPGNGGHPRGLAIDVMLADINDDYGIISVDQGTDFDEFTELDEYGAALPVGVRGLAKASRLNPFLTEKQKENQWVLERMMLLSAWELGMVFMPLASEHWDFRFPKNEAELRYVLEAFHRVIKKDYATLPEITDYETAKHHFNEHFAPQIGNFPAKENIIFYDDFDCVQDWDCVKI